MWVDSVGVALGELLEGEAGPLDDHVVDRGLEAGGRHAGDVVVDLIEGVADGQAGGDLGDREAGGLGCQGRGARDARVHLDHEDLLGLGIDGELHVRAARLDPDRADHGDRLVAQLLVEAVGQRLLRGDGDRVARCGRPSGRRSRSSRRSRRCRRGRASPPARTRPSRSPTRRAGPARSARPRGPGRDPLEVLLAAGDAAAAPAEREGRAARCRAGPARGGPRGPGRSRWRSRCAASCSPARSIVVAEQSRGPPRR